MYNKTESVPAVYAEMKNAGHLSFNSEDQKWAPYVIAMYDCHLKGNEKGC